MADAVAAVGRDERERFRRRGKFDVERGCLVFAQLELLELQLGIHKHREVGSGISGFFRGSKPNEPVESHGGDAALFAQLREVKSDAAVRVHGENRVAFGGEIRVTQLGAALRVQRAIGDGVPKMPASRVNGCRAIWDEDGQNRFDRWHRNLFVGGNVAMIVLLRLGDRTGAHVDAGILGNEPGEFEAFAGQSRDLCMRLRDFFAQPLLFIRKSP